MQHRSIDFSQRRFLVVENQTLMRRLLYATLRSFGAGEIREARGFPQAVEQLYAERFDAVVLDFSLGDREEGDGADLVRRARRDDGCLNQQTPMLLIAAAPDHAMVLKARDAGVDAMLAKPLAPKDLYQRLYAVLALPRPFLVTPDYVGPRRKHPGRSVPAPARPSAARLMRGGTRGRRRPAPPPADPANEDQILL